uniref:F-box/LRR-repeat protein 2-like n=1 Tax=Fragaria vesca subsp. vesca TaxID=101020 RepID=UPI0005C81214|nr:PREDICTED: F-box/LRR-repeat protein 2-like [Fragaria vesca subsp. vesca]
MAQRFGGICVLGEDELDLIVNKFSDPADRKSVSEVCKLWYKVESLNRSSLRLLAPGCPRQVFPRYPNLVKFETTRSISDCDLAFLGETCSKLEVVNLNGLTGVYPPFVFSGVGLLSLAKHCPKLSKVMLNNVRLHIIHSVPISLISLAPNLRHLDLGSCPVVTDETLEAIGSSSSISYLNLAGCFKITDRGLGFLANGSVSKSLKTLFLAWIKGLTDVGVSHLHKMHCLEHLSLANRSVSEITDIGGVAISTIATLKRLSLQLLHKISDLTIRALARNCPNLEFLDLSKCGITGAGVRAFSGHPSLRTIILRFCEVDVSDLDHLVLRCPSLKSILLDNKKLEQMLPLIGTQTRSFVKGR